MKYIVIFIVIVLTGCGIKPVEPAPASDSSKKSAKQALDRLEEKGNTESTGAVHDGDFPPVPAVSVRTGEPGWVLVEETRAFSNAVAPDKARQELLQILRNEAVSKKVPTSVEVTSLLTDMMSESNGMTNEHSAWSGFFKTTVSGVITAEEILMDTLIPTKNGYKKTIKLNAYVEPVSGQRDLAFYVDAALENNLLKAGDELALSVTPSKDSYIYIFNLMGDHHAMLMFPNEYFPDNFIQSGVTLEIPDPVVRQYKKFRVAAMPGEDLTSESVYIVCSKSPIKLIETLPKIGTEIPVFSGESQSFTQLQHWLTRIPLDQRVEKNLVYLVSNH